MEMVIHAQFKSISGATPSPSKIPEYAKDFKNEWLYIRGVNKKCWEFCQQLEYAPEYEHVFWSKRAKALLKHFDYVLESQKTGEFQDFKHLKFKLSAVCHIIQLRNTLYSEIKNRFSDFFIFDDEFQDFFERVILFTRSVVMTCEEDFEDDIVVAEVERQAVRRLNSLSELDLSSDSDSDGIIYSDTDTDSDSDSD